MPDFLLITEGGASLPVEAKLLTQSDIEKSFNTWAGSLVDQLKQHPAVVRRPAASFSVVVKDALNKPSFQEVVARFSGLCDVSVTESVLLRGPLFNILRTPLEIPAGRHPIAPLPVLNVLAPRSEKEALRVQGRAKKASKQLRANRSNEPRRAFMPRGRSAGSRTLHRCPVKTAHGGRELFRYRRSTHAGLAHTSRSAESFSAGKSLSGRDGESSSGLHAGYPTPP